MFVYSELCTEDKSAIKLQFEQKNNTTTIYIYKIKKKKSLILHTSLEDIALFLNLKYVGFLWCVVVFLNFIALGQKRGQPRKALQLLCLLGSLTHKFH